MYPKINLIIYIYIYFCCSEIITKKHCEIKFTCLFSIGSQTRQQLAPEDARYL